MTSVISMKIEESEDATKINSRKKKVSPIEKIGTRKISHGRGKGY